MHTSGWPVSTRTQTTILTLAGAVSVAGVALALAALGLAAWQTLGWFGEIPLYFIIREWAASPTMLLLLFTILWIERLVTLYRSGHARLMRLGYSRPTKRLIGRFSQWLGLLWASISATIALHRLADFGVTAAMITSILTFGLSMWLLEGLSFRQALGTQRAGRDGEAAANEPFGC